MGLKYEPTTITSAHVCEVVVLKLTWWTSLCLSRRAPCHAWSCSGWWQQPGAGLLPSVAERLGVVVTRCRPPPSLSLPVWMSLIACVNTSVSTPPLSVCVCVRVCVCVCVRERERESDLADVSLPVATGPASRMVLLWLVATAMHGTAPVAERMGVVVTHPLSLITFVDVSHNLCE